MAWTTKQRIFATAASVCVAIIGISVIWPMVRENPELVAPPAASEPAPPDELPAPATATQTEPVVEEAPAHPAPIAETGPVAPAVKDQPLRGSAPENRDAPTPAEVRATATEEPVAEDLREKLVTAQEIQTNSETVIDAMTAEDIGKLPDTSAPESVPRMPGITADGLRAAEKKERERSEQLEEVNVTGARRSTPHKSVAQATRGSGSGRVRAVILPAAAPPPPPASDEYAGRDRFENFESNPVKQVSEVPVSTFSADVDTSSYGFVRKQLNQGVLPQKDAVRVEEMINYFDYAWPAAESREAPFRPTIVVSDSPWNKGRKLIHIGIKGYELPARQRPDANLVLLIDVSGSMDSPDKLPLVKDSMRLLVNNLKPADTVGIVVYAGAAGLVLPPTPVSEKEKILESLASLTPGGSTAGAEGIRLAYELAEKSFRKEGVNRILLATDGDFNVGIDSTNELKGFVERKREKGVFLSVLGYGQGNYRDELAQALAQNGNGVAAYIDTLNEAHKVLVQEASSSLFTIAKDVKLQVEFNPTTVAEYRLVGYETRALKREDFNNDAVDAGDVGSGHTVTAIYEITPVGSDARAVDERRYAPADKAPESKGTSKEYGFLKIRYKMPDGHKSQLIEQPILIDARVPGPIARDVAFSTAVAGFAQMLRGGAYTGTLKFDDVARQALESRGEDPFGYRNEFVQLVRKAQNAKGM
jgi:Ca-activated chloride channel family protein